VNPKLELGLTVQCSYLTYHPPQLLLQFNSVIGRVLSTGLLRKVSFNQQYMQLMFTCDAAVRVSCVVSFPCAPPLSATVYMLVVLVRLIVRPP